jgi:hypothetical protein
VKEPLHPLVVGLIRELPEPDTAWSDEWREKWLAVAKLVLDMLYKQPETAARAAAPKEK